MEHCDASTSTTDAAPPPPPPPSHEKDHQIAKKDDQIAEKDHQIDDIQEETIIPRDPCVDLSNATSGINTPASSPLCILMNTHYDILENVFLRVPAHQYPQIRTMCRTLKTFLDEGIFIRRYIEEVVKRGEIIIPVKLRWKSRAARYKNRCPDRVSWRLGCNLGSCYYRCYNAREIQLAEYEAECPRPVPCHGRLFCPWIECATWHRWFDGGFVRAFLRIMTPEIESNFEHPRSPRAPRPCSVTRSASCSSCMASLLCIKNPITGIYKRLPLIDGRWTSKLKCIATYGGDRFRVLVAMPAVTHEGSDREKEITFVKTMIYDSGIDSWRELIDCSLYGLRNIRVVDTHGVYCRDAMYWLLEAAQRLIVFQVEEETWEILKVRKPESGLPLGLVACMEQVLMAEARDRALVIRKLITGNEEGEWLEISRSTEEIFKELQDTDMAIHNACSSNGDDIVCFENLLNRTAVTYNVNTGSWGRSNDIHGV